MFLPGALGSPKAPTFVTWVAVEMEEATEGRVGTKLMLKDVLERDRVQGVALLVSGYIGEHQRVSHGHCGCCVSDSWSGRLQSVQLSRACSASSPPACCR